MKNQYVGDIGDYTKLGILRAIEKAGFSIGINWYLTSNDDEVNNKQTDGKHTKYLCKMCDTPDTVLYSALKEIVVNGLRQVEELENGQLFNNAIFYSEVLDFSKYLDKKQFRDMWHKKAIELLKFRDVIFLDPDNGLEVKSYKPHSKKGNKYTTYKEAAAYFKSGSSVIVYNHRDHTPEHNYLERFTRFRDSEYTPDAELFYVRAFRYSIRDYIFIAQKQHAYKLKKVIDEMLETGWNKYLSYREL